MNRPRHTTGQRAATSLLTGLFAIAAASGVVQVRAQQGPAPYQPFDVASPASSPTPPAARPVRRTPTGDVPVARAVPVEPATAPAASPARRQRRPATDPSAPAAATPARAYPKPGDNGPDEPAAPTTASDRAASAAAAGNVSDAGMTVSDATPAPAPAASPAATLPPRAAQGRGARPGAATVPGDSTAATAAPPPDNGDDATDIRIAPQEPGKAVSAEEKQFNLANQLYVRKEFAQAGAEYEKYLSQFPDGKQRQAALWWLGESHRTLKRMTSARTAYQNLVVGFQEGEYVGPANFRLATLDFEAHDYQSALNFFRRAAALAKGDDVRLYSRFSEALCLEQLNRKEETAEIYDDILSVQKDNPYRDASHLALAKLAVSQNHPNEAFKQYEALSREAAKPALQAESAYNAGVFARQIDQNDTASALFTRAINLPGVGATVRADAMVAQIHLLYDTNKYRQLLDFYPTVRAALPEALQPEALLMAANSQRQLGQHRDAREAYDDLITQYPATPQAGEARYQRVVSLYGADDIDFVKEADNYLVNNADPLKADQVRLMKADTLFKRRDYLAAAQAYAALDNSTTLPAKYKAEAGYRMGYSFAQAHQPEKTVVAFTKFLRSFPEHPFAAKALVQRAVAYQQLKNYASALRDFTEVVNDHKDAKEREVSLAQRALILGQQGDGHGMMDAFRLLLKDYPNTETAGLAHYSIANSAFNDTKEYPLALSEFEAARKTAPKEYGPKSWLMMIFCEYQLKDKAKLAAEVDAYQKSKPATAVPATILAWLGGQEFDAKEYAAAEGHLATAVTTPGAAPDTWLQLARARINLQRWEGALEGTRHYLESNLTDPGARAQGLLVQGDAQIGQKKFDEAQKSIDETLQLQPEGTLNARAIMLRGKLEFAQGKYEDAAKSYLSVSVLYDDNDLTPEALRLAAEAFEKAGLPKEAAKANGELKSRFPAFTSASNTVP